MQDRHHTYESLHKEHHIWRKDLLISKKTLSELTVKVKHRIINSKSAEDKVVCKELESRLGLLLHEIENKLENLTDTDKVMSETQEKHNVVSQELFLLNSRMRAGLIEFDKGCDRVIKDIEGIS